MFKHSIEYDAVQLLQGNNEYTVTRTYVEILRSFKGHFSDKEMAEVLIQRRFFSSYCNEVKELCETKFVYIDDLNEDIERNKNNLERYRKLGFKEIEW